MSLSVLSAWVLLQHQEASIFSGHGVLPATWVSLQFWGCSLDASCLLLAKDKEGEEKVEAHGHSPLWWHPCWWGWESVVSCSPGVTEFVLCVSNFVSSWEGVDAGEIFELGTVAV